MKRLLKLLAFPDFRIIAGLAASALLIWLFGELTEEILERELLVRMDDLVLALLHLIRSPALTGVMIFVTDLGSPYIIAPGTILLVIFLLLSRRKSDAGFAGLVMAIGAILNTIVKISVQRARPYPPPGGPLVEAWGWSYPSGHALLATLFYFTVAYTMGRSVKRKHLRIAMAAAALLISGLISISRVYLGVHYPSDVLAGMTGGILWFTICLTAMRLYELKKKRKTGP
ncbi:MAG: phosphatase PAP2 family protein [Syntrophales bacterium]|nr:phosphatase PAP2 family protein [Syntrophales bacterium]